MIKLLSIDLSNYCSKECPFCYNHSSREGSVVWMPTEVIALAKDCIGNGVRAVSLGGGEPFEYGGVFDIIDALVPLCYVSVTTNGLPLLDANVFDQLTIHKPDKVHITIHNPDKQAEVDRVESQLLRISDIGIKPGVNLLVINDKLAFAKAVYKRLRTILNSDQIILVPQRFSNTPTPKQLAGITEGQPFQSPSCLLGCQTPTNFVSLSFDKKVNFCSYAGGKAQLEELTYQGIVNALKKVKFTSCLF